MVHPDLSRGGKHCFCRVTAWETPSDSQSTMGPWEALRFTEFESPEIILFYYSWLCSFLTYWVTLGDRVTSPLSWLINGFIVFVHLMEHPPPNQHSCLLLQIADEGPGSGDSGNAGLESMHELLSQKDLSSNPSSATGWLCDLG